MATLQPKKVHGHTYWQIVESRRVNGKPRPIVLKHLGKAEDLLALLQGSSTPVQADIREFGAIAAAWLAAQDLKLAEIIQNNCPKRDQGQSVAHYVLTAAINRIVQPQSKARIAAWYQQSVLARLKPMRSQQLTSQRFWDHFDYLEEKDLDAIEEELSRDLVQNHAVDLESLFFDATNFDSFIDSANPARLPQRGHAKSKRSDLRIVGLALLASSDFHIPLFWKVYPGNQADSITFANALPSLAKRHRQWCQGSEKQITLVFDKGNNSEENIAFLSRTPFRIVGSLVPSQHADLLAIPQGAFNRLPERFGKTWAHRTSKEVFGRKWTIVVTLSANLRRGQLRGIRQHLRKRILLLEQLKKKIERSKRPQARGKPYTKQSLLKHVQTLTSGQYIKDILRVTIQENNGKWHLRHRIDRKALAHLKKNILGKRILFTDHDEWDEGRIVDAYRGQHHVERAFRDLKSNDLIRFAPMYHWTDSKIRVHALCCVLALILVGVIHRKVVRAGLDISRETLVRELKGIRQVITLYPPAPGNMEKRKAGRPRAKVILSRTSALQKQLIDVLELGRCLPS
mgnify:CR=1 FL=1